MTRPRSPIPAAALVLWALAAAGARAGEDGGAALTLDYRVYLGGLHVLSLSSALDQAREGGYRMTVAAHTDGLIGKFVDASYEAESDGRAEGAVARSERYRGRSRDGDDAARSVAVTYRRDAAPEVVFEPADAAPDEPLPADTIAATTDPVSAMLTLMRTLAETGRCEATMRVFDGRRRYDLVASDAGARTLTASRQAPDGGPARECSVRIDRIAGFRDGKLAKRYPDEIAIYLAPVFPGAPPVPVRLHANNLFGALRMHLVNPQPAAADERAGLDGALSRE